MLLTGPARGYVRRELERRSVPHVHRLLPTRDELTTAYHALDAYVVASRQEGGPKSILESMATGVPLVTTRAGQAPDLVVDGENGILVDVEDADGDRGRARAHPPRHRARDRAPRGRAADGSRELPRAPRAALGGAARRVRGATGWIASASRATAAPRHAGAGSSSAAVPARGSACSTAGTGSQGPGEQVAGGTAKLQKLAERWPNRPTDFSLLYLGTTYLPRDLRPLLWLAKKRGARIVVNQDGVAYPGWAGARTDELNVPLRRAVLVGRPRRVPERVQQALV